MHLRLLAALACAATAAAQNTIDYSAYMTANSLGSKGAGQSFTPQDATGYAGGPTQTLTELHLWSGNLGGPGSTTTYIAVYDGDPDTASLVGMSNNSIDTSAGAGVPNYTQWTWTFDGLALDPATEYWCVTSSAATDVHPTTTVERSLQEYNFANDYAGGDAIIADRERHQNNYDLRFLAVFADGSTIGSNYCGPANLNSSGQAAVISAFGSDVAADNSVRLDAEQMPQNQFGYFINSMTQGFSSPPGSQGNLCVSGQIGRHSANVLNTGATGEFSLQLDLTNLPVPSGTYSVMPGETWYWQAWFRDMNPGQTNNFTDGICITFN